MHLLYFMITFFISEKSLQIPVTNFPLGIFFFPPFEVSKISLFGGSLMIGIILDISCIIQSHWLAVLDGLGRSSCILHRDDHQWGGHQRFL